MGGIERLAEAISADLSARLPRQRKTQRGKLSLLVATMLEVRSANLMALAASLPRPAERPDMRYQWVKRLLANDLVDSDEVMAYYASLGITVQRVMTDNGSCYKSHKFRKACIDHGLKHVRTRPYTPKTNGKAERFIQTALREWAYAQAYENSARRAEELPLWLHRYNWHRPHGSLKAQTPISRLGLTEDNVLRLHTRTA